MTLRRPARNVGQVKERDILDCLQAVWEGGRERGIQMSAVGEMDQIRMKARERSGGLGEGKCRGRRRATI